ncbi:MAG: type II toxin-antitoxin system mRNA interferase toxin, RelE/StbE family [Rhodanobacter sp.]
MWRNERWHGRDAGKRSHEQGKPRALMILLIETLPMPAGYFEPSSRGRWSSFHDTQLAPDWLLIHKIDGDTVRFERTGRHTDLFDE